MRTVIFVITLLSNWSLAGANSMTQEEMEKIITDKTEVIEHKKGYVLFNYKKTRMALISDTTHDRMRIIAPITSYTEVTEEQKEAIMESNYHKSLDARYAVSNGALYSAYIHPLSPLTQKQVEDALNQVSTLALTFGSTYSSGSLSFGRE